jgi:hypothetical protein
MNFVSTWRSVIIFLNFCNIPNIYLKFFFQNLYEFLMSMQFVTYELHHFWSLRCFLMPLTSLSSFGVAYNIVQHCVQDDHTFFYYFSEGWIVHVVILKCFFNYICFNVHFILQLIMFEPLCSSYYAHLFCSLYHCPILNLVIHGFVHIGLSSSLLLHHWRPSMCWPHHLQFFYSLSPSSLTSCLLSSCLGLTSFKLDWGVSRPWHPRFDLDLLRCPNLRCLVGWHPILGSPWNISLGWRVNNYEKYMQILGGAIWNVSSN